MSSDSRPGTTAWLVPLAGPTIDPLQLAARAGGITLGRSEHCDLPLPPDAESVSRQHARFLYDAGTWRIIDLCSRWGTFVNGVRIEPGAQVPVREGDFVRIIPWTFAFSTRGPGARGGVRSTDDHNDTTMHTMIRSVGPGQAAAPLAEDLLALLLESAAAVHAATDEPGLAAAVLDAAVRGTGMPNGALLRPLDAQGTVEVIAARRAPADDGTPVYSRTLLAAASQGATAELADAAAHVVGDASHSIAQLRITSAVCVPLMLGPTIAAYLYLDARGGRTRVAHQPSPRLRPNAAAFCTALGRMASLALSNLKRIDVERRQALIEHELGAAAAAQRWILPRRQTCARPFTCVGESRPGAYIGGDFFDVIPLAEGKLAVAVGDVSGHGVAASVLMTATQGFLHAALRQHGNPAQAVNDLNAFIHPRRSDEKFVTLWVGVFDAAAHTLTYVDAGHGYAMMIGAAGEDENVRTLDERGGMPLGLSDDAEYADHTEPLVPGGRVLVLSDGIVEQGGAVAGSAGAFENEQFGVSGVRDVLRDTQVECDVVNALFEAVVSHAGTDRFQDDATAVLVAW